MRGDGARARLIDDSVQVGERERVDTAAVDEALHLGGERGFCRVAHALNVDGAD